MKKLAGMAAAIALFGSVSAAQANGLDFSGTVSMGLQGTTINGHTDISPVARLQGEVSYTLETDMGVTFVLALEFDQTLADTSHREFLPGHR